jgi:hypothetical protein
MLENKATDWRPISEAPRDGTRFLGSDGADVGICWWDVIRWTEYHEVEGGLFKKENKEYGKFVGVSWYSEFIPAHWMPSPTPPTEASDA